MGKRSIAESEDIIKYKDSLDTINNDIQTNF
jgi:hypothetical protein